MVPRHESSEFPPLRPACTFIASRNEFSVSTGVANQWGCFYKVHLLLSKHVKLILKTSKKTTDWTHSQQRPAPFYQNLVCPIPSKGRWTRTRLISEFYTESRSIFPHPIANVCKLTIMCSRNYVGQSVWLNLYSIRSGMAAATSFLCISCPFPHRLQCTSMPSVLQIHWTIFHQFLVAHPLLHQKSKFFNRILTCLFCNY